MPFKRFFLLLAPFDPISDVEKAGLMPEQVELASK
jgi:hypothetical protein